MAEDQQNNNTTTNREINRTVGKKNRNFKRFNRGPNLSVDDMYFVSKTLESGWTRVRVETHIKSTVGFFVFKDLLSNYVVKKYPNTLAVANNIKDGSNPMNEFKEMCKPEAKTKIELGSVDELILKEQMKDYIVRSMNIENNIIKVYTLI